MAKHVTENSISLRLPTSLLTAIDDHSFEVRVKSRNKMILDLIREGLKARGVTVDEE